MPAGRGGVGEGFGGFFGGAHLADYLDDVHLGGDGVGTGGGGDQEAFAGAHGEPAVAAQLEAAAAPGAAAGRFGGLVDEVAEGELAGVVGSGEAGAQLAGGVVDHPLIVTGFEVVAHPAGEHAGVVGTGFVAGGERRQVGAVMDLAGDHRAVDVAVEEADDDFGADARQEMAAPVGAGQPFGDADPGARLFIARRVAGLARGVGGEAAGVGLFAALPGKLDLHPVIALGAQRRAADADHQGKLRRCEGLLQRLGDDG